ncbi:VOC family protein [Nocardia sp. NPDC006044]|uniref:VOC family protein n=1 Tax=Nocardia sp. NPDC006044 TaxID=3364306 RepID=UPI0036BB7CC2
MRIREVAISTTDLDAAAQFYRNVLELPVAVGDDHVTVEIGLSTLILTRGETFAGAHHLAFGISPDDFGLAWKWLGRRVELITSNGSEIIEGPPGWDSRSVYFRGPDGVVLELIARAADAGVAAGTGEAPRLLSISEVGIGVPDVRQAVGELTEAYGLAAFTPQLPVFTPVGDHDGLIILVDRERIWFPTEADLPARAAVAVRIDAPKGGATLTLGEVARIDG